MSNVVEVSLFLLPPLAIVTQASLSVLFPFMSAWKNRFNLFLLNIAIAQVSLSLHGQYFLCTSCANSSIWSIAVTVTVTVTLTSRLQSRSRSVVSSRPILHRDSRSRSRSRSRHGYSHGHGMLCQAGQYFIVIRHDQPSS